MKKVAVESVDTWSLRVTCKGDEYSANNKACGVVWEVNRNDIVRIRLWIMGELETIHYGFVCPECNTFTEIDRNSIPVFVRNNCPFYSEPTRKKRRIRKIIRGWLLED